MSALLPYCDISYPFTGYVVRKSLARESSSLAAVGSLLTTNLPTVVHKSTYLMRLREAGEVDQLRRAG